MTRLPFDPDKAAGDSAKTKPTRDRLTVSQATQLIKSTLEQRLPATIHVIGEVSNLAHSNHWYFSLKDDKAVLSCVAWASSAKKFGFVPSEGDEVVATGHISHYPPQGRTQLYVTGLKPVGAGALELKFRAMCDELRKLGYFDVAHKKPLPLFPMRIAVITSEGGAALHDVIATASARCKAVSLLIVDTRVQGEEAAKQIASTIRWVDKNSHKLGIDAILVTRGGGSTEDLWSFNEREVADATFKCKLPIVAAIGHESDTSVIELVADVRAATPTQAAMLLVPDSTQLNEQLNHQQHRLTSLVSRLVQQQKQRLEVLQQYPLFKDPLEFVRDARQNVERIHLDLSRVIRSRVMKDQSQIEQLANRLGRLRPEIITSDQRQRLAVLRDRLHRVMKIRLDQRQTLLTHRKRLERSVFSHFKYLTERTSSLARQLASVGPDRVLARGFSYTTTNNGKLIRSIGDVSSNQHIVTRLIDGTFDSIVALNSKQKSKRITKPISPRQMDLFDQNR
ncbi:MAG: exodeoxyribonuclease VII large subunit [Planctomycetes bacterium]|nr:exodeoxyribonuclease VII large subunit [Planctomycetota bacterium]